MALSRSSDRPLTAPREYRTRPWPAPASGGDARRWSGLWPYLAADARGHTGSRSGIAGCSDDRTDWRGSRDRGIRRHHLAGAISNQSGGAGYSRRERAAYGDDRGRYANSRWLYRGQAIGRLQRRVISYETMACASFRWRRTPMERASALPRRRRPRAYWQSEWHRWLLRRPHRLAGLPRRWHSQASSRPGCIKSIW